jgi:chitin-binding protein
MIPKALRFLLILVLLAGAALLVTRLSIAHGSLLVPLSRVFGCYLEGPESPDTLPCQELVNMSGTQPLYDWNEVNIRDAGENSRSIIPDGRLCGAGRDKFIGLDQARSDWPAAVLPSGGAYTFLWSITASHPVATFYFYVTRDGFDPNVPLKWSDLEATPFATIENPAIEEIGLQYPVYRFNVQLPQKTGRHMIYSIWTRHDSLENFYACSDVWFGSAPTPVPTTAPACTAPAWQSGTLYSAGSVVNHNGKQWEAKWTNTEEPSTAGGTAAWKILSYCTAGGGGTPPPTATRTSTPTRSNTPVGPTATRTSTPTRSNTPVGPTATRTRTPTRSNTPVGPTATRTRTPTRSNTPVGPTPTRTATSGGGAACSPVTATITAPFTYDGSGTFCWQVSSLAYINSWNLASLTVNGVTFTNLYATAAQLPVQINGYWYVSYTGNYAWSHFEVR